jgi:hypothetical protein
VITLLLFQKRFLHREATETDHRASTQLSTEEAKQAV